MLIIILGAGASYDSGANLDFRQANTSGRLLTGHNEDRPPLTNELFEDRSLFMAEILRFSECMPLIPTLRKPRTAVQRELRPRHTPVRHAQLAAIRYFLHTALSQCQQRWQTHHKGITNHLALLDEIERWRQQHGEQVCWVTFNYDTILEQAIHKLLGFNIENIDSYSQ